MIICLCKAVSSRTILAEIRRGNSTVSGIAQACQAGTGCGACVRQIHEMINGQCGTTRGQTDVPVRR